MPIGIAIGAISIAATPSTPNATAPAATPAQLMSENCWNALPVTNIAAPIPMSAATPSNTLGLPSTCKPLP